MTSMGYRDNLQYAYPVLYSFGVANESVPIHLARISCPADAVDLNSCQLGGGWGSVAGCTHTMDVGVQCGPVAYSTKSPLYNPDLTCNHTHATVRYVKSENPDLTTSMIKLFGDVPTGCQFRVAETDSYVEAYIPLDGCGGSLSLSNESTIAIRLELIRHYMAPQSGIISQLPVRFGVTCLIPRDYRIQSDPLVAPELIADLLGGTSGVAASLKMFRDPHCAVYDGLTVVPLSPNEVGFTFSAFYLGQAGAVVPVPTNLYLHCDTRVCHVNETSSSCTQFCRKPIVKGDSSLVKIRRKRDDSAVIRRQNIPVTEGPVLVGDTD
ncbi:unnamed protein product [Echinostoma caproni]|uniref:SRCR domain-containing protein n=1 Tax=Echinostoma caproni TaxID=27848 RepID=A0A183ACZ0_9TREM|nr:unnamed protein product [Echinostoma caproni]